MIKISIYDTPSKELNKIAQLPSVEERMSDLNEAYALSAILNENPLFEEMKDEYEYLNDHYLKDFKTFLCGVKKSLIGSILDYSFPCLNSLSETNIKRLEVIQNSAVRSILKLRYDTPSNILLNEAYIKLKLLTVSNRLFELSERYVRAGLSHSVSLTVRLVEEYNKGFESRYIEYPTPLFLKRKITEVEEETPQETVIPTKKNKKTIDKEAEKVVQASTSSDISKKVEAPLKRGRGRPRKNL
ncbi:hypothetical protein BpHYR1_012102 [Brachionus plicatilis]|uniref:Uncharacterized protein n=1 Tax=Brachionus plicatilis TaxID=10195 RepID=A0A3M7R3G6_BRAPC|nr:hypothetical protein BpHYR1_012102 [Brachionus plicatilis]